MDLRDLLKFIPKMSSDEEFRILGPSDTSSQNPQDNLHRRLSSGSTLKSVYIESHSSSPHSSSVQSDLNLIAKARLQQRSKPINLNLLVLGDSNIGKTSFINTILIKYFRLINLKPKNPPKPTRQFLSNKAVISNSDLELRVNLIDTPGFGFFSNREKWIKTVSEYVFDQASDYKKIKKTTEKSQLEDKRIHLALYFIEGPRCKESDLSILFELQKFVNILPVLAKADGYSQTEIFEVKLGILTQCIDAEIQFFDVVTAEEVIRELGNSELGTVPPFAIISAGRLVEFSAKIKFFREYPWGVCDIHDKHCSDFKLLCKLLFGYLVIPIIESAKKLNRENLRKLKSANKKVKEKEQQACKARKLKWLSKFASKLILHLL